jgi:hypothetical protein
VYTILYGEKVLFKGEQILKGFREIITRLGKPLCDDMWGTLQGSKILLQKMYAVIPL